MKNEVALSKRVYHDGKDLGPYRDHLKARDPNDPRLQPPKIDELDAYFLWVFNQLSRSRIYDQGYPFSIALNAYLDYMKLFDDSLDEDEILVLQALDDAFLEQTAKNRE